MIRNIFFTILLLSIFTGSSAQNSLLWEISGNGLKKPSYLYGTMHLKDKRIFNFYDSLLVKIHNCDAFALEIHPDSLNQSLLKSLKKSTNANDDMDDSGLSEEEKKELREQLEKELGVAMKKFRMKDLRKLKRYIGKTKAAEDEMPAILDAYLFNIAHRQGKEMMGLESVSEHDAALDQMDGAKEKTVQYVKEQLAGKNDFNLESMVQAYLKADFSFISDNYDSFSEEFVYSLLTKRNIKMAERIDSIVRLKSLFSAVGAAHLPGEQGMISLLKKKGYTVTPVNPARTGIYKTSSYPQVELAWYKKDLVNAGMSFEMPAKPEIYDGGNVLLDMYIYPDLGTGNTYFSYAYPAFIKEEDAEERLNAVIRVYEKNPKYQFISKKKIEKSGAAGTEFEFKTKGNYRYKAWILFRSGVLYFHMAAYHRNNQFPKDLDRFFNSLEIKDRKIPGWEDIKDEYGACGFMIPGSPKEKIMESGTPEALHKIHIYTGSDKDNVLYLLRYYNMPEGYYIQDEKKSFAEFIGLLSSRASPEKQEVKDTLIEGVPAQSFYMEYSEGSLIKGTNFLRGSRVYTIMGVVTGKNSLPEELDRFFGSFHFTAFKNMPVKLQYVEDSLLKVMSFAKPEINTIDTSYYSDFVTRTYSFYNEYQGVSYFIQNSELGDYFYAKNDSVVFESIKTAEALKDSFAEIKQRKENNTYISEYVVHHPESHNIKRVKVILQGKQIYYLFAYLQNSELHTAQNDSIFNSFSFNKNVPAFDPLSSKLKELFSDLRSVDTTVFKKVKKNISDYAFAKTDVPAMLAFLSEEMPDDTLSYGSSREKVYQALQDVADSSAIGFIEKQFPVLQKRSPDLANSALRVLLEMKTKESFLAFKKLLLLQSGKDLGVYDGLFYSANDSLPLLRTLFPEVLSLLKDTSDVYSAFRSASMLMDSSLLSWNDMKPYAGVMKKIYTKALENARKDKEYYLDVFLGRILSREGEKEFTPLSDKVFKTKNIYNISEMYAILLKRHYAAPVSVARTLADDPATRVTLYDDLREAERLDLFPEKYRNQQALSESDLYERVLSDYEIAPTAIKFEKEIIRDSSGVQQKFYIYKIEFKEKEMATGVGYAGPFSVTDYKLVPRASLTGYMDQAYDKKMLDFLFEEYYQEMTRSNEED